MQVISRRIHLPDCFLAENPFCSKKTVHWTVFSFFVDSLALNATKKKAPAKAEAFFLVNLTASQVETLFVELEYIEPRLKALGVGGEDE